MERVGRDAPAKSAVAAGADDPLSPTTSCDEVATALVGAVGRGEIVVLYQPVIELVSQSIDAFEALARWQRGSELVPADDGIAVAEATGAVAEIGEHVVLSAAAEAGRWYREGYRTNLWVNVSPGQLEDPGFVTMLDRATDVLPGPHLIVELTSIVTLSAQARAAIEHIRAAGVHLALDNVGAGDSAAAALAQVPVDAIKIGRSIIEEIEGSDARAVVGATVAFARTLGLSVVAEGVERRAQHRALRELGCSHAQGSFYSPPVDAHDAVRLLRAGPGALPG